MHVHEFGDAVDKRPGALCRTVTLACAMQRICSNFGHGESVRGGLKLAAQAILFAGSRAYELGAKTAQILSKQVVSKFRGGALMKFITAIIKPFKLDEVREALMGLGVQGLTVTEVKGFGRQKGHREIYRGAEYAVSFVPKIKIEVAVTEAMMDAVISTISAKAKTGQIGDGKIFVTSLEHVVRIRTGEADAEAL
jgi:nitrogen regulatory protein P-II 2